MSRVCGFSTAVRHRLVYGSQPRLYRTAESPEAIDCYATLDKMENQWVTHHLDASDGGLDKSEWLLTNGTGGYAMGTAAGVNTRRYHGLLVVAARPPVGRVVALNQMLERLTPDLTGKAEGLELTSA